MRFAASRYPSLGAFQVCDLRHDFSQPQFLFCQAGLRVMPEGISIKEVMGGGPALRGLSTNILRTELMREVDSEGWR